MDNFTFSCFYFLVQSRLEDYIFHQILKVGFHTVSYMPVTQTIQNFSYQCVDNAYKEQQNKSVQCW